jgi:hypothetical protein
VKTYTKFTELLSEVTLPKRIVDPACALAAKEINGLIIEIAFDDATMDLDFIFNSEQFVRFSPRYGSIIINKGLYSDAKIMFDNGNKLWQKFLKKMNKEAKDEIKTNARDLKLNQKIALEWWKDMLETVSRKVPAVDKGAFERDAKLADKYHKVLITRMKQTRMKSPLKKFPPLGLLDGDVVSNITNEKNEWFEKYTSQWSRVAEDLFFSPSQCQWCFGGDYPGPWEIDYEYPDDDPDRAAILDDKDDPDSMKINNKYHAAWDAFISNMKNRSQYFSDLPEELKGTEKECGDYFNEICDYNYKNGPLLINEGKAQKEDMQLDSLFSEIDYKS